jgi:hypothetical protein
MPTWTCPACKRQFGRRNQSHGCAPAQTVESYFESRPAAYRRAHDAIVRHLGKLGPLVVDAVSVGIMYKRSRTFAEVRAKRDRLELGFLLSRPLAHPRLRKTLKLSANRMAYFVDLHRAADVDRDVRAWLTEAYATSPD